MTIDETKRVLTAIQTAYPYFHKSAAKSEIELTIDLWASTFMNVRYEIVMLAVKKLIATNTFAPTIAEVKKKIEQIRYEAMESLMTGVLTTEQANDLRLIVDGCRQMGSEPSLMALIEERRQGLEAHDISSVSLPTL